MENETKKTEKKQTEKKHQDSFFKTWHWAAAGLLIVLLFFNQYQLSTVSGMMGRNTGYSFGSFASGISLLSGKSGVMIGPQLNHDGRTTKLVEWPTISPVPKLPSNPSVEEIIAYVIPKGTPKYAAEGPGVEQIRGVTFDDPITSQKIWGSLLGSRRFGTQNEVKLTAEEEKRWEGIVGKFTCDYCCGGPNSVTVISRCGCAHSYAWQGMAKFFIKYYSDYTDEDIMGEMTRWKAAFYPKGVVQDVLVYTGQASPDTLTHGGSVGIRAQFSGQGGSTSTAPDLASIEGMVGGC